MSDGRTSWWAKDAAWPERERIVILVDEFGAEGYATMDVLSCQAKQENRGGWFKTGCASVARRGGVSSTDRVRSIVARAAELGAIDDLSDDGGLTFTGRVSGWKSEQDHARKAKAQGDYRGRQEGPNDVSLPITDDHDVSPTGQDSTEQQQPSSSQAQNAARAGARSNGSVDQTKRPDDFPDDLVEAGHESLKVLRRVWQQRGGVEPQARGVGLAIMRNVRADHVQIALELEHWLTAGSGQRTKVRDVAKRFGDRVADADAQHTPGTMSTQREIQMAEKRERDERRLAALHRIADQGGRAA